MMTFWYANSIKQSLAFIVKVKIVFDFSPNCNYSWQIKPPDSPHLRLTAFIAASYTFRENSLIPIILKHTS